jgi:hypothetical protein
MNLSAVASTFLEYKKTISIVFGVGVLLVGIINLPSKIATGLSDIQKLQKDVVDLQKSLILIESVTKKNNCETLNLLLSNILNQGIFFETTEVNLLKLKALPEDIAMARRIYSESTNANINAINNLKKVNDCN